jgi:hypothetical protein
MTLFNTLILIIIIIILIIRYKYLYNKYQPSLKFIKIKQQYFLFLFYNKVYSNNIERTYLILF